jgi:hypothetical protein
MDFNLNQEYPDMSAVLNADDADRIKTATGDAAMLSWVKVAKQAKEPKPGMYLAQLELMYGHLYAKGLCSKGILAKCKEEFNRIEQEAPKVDMVEEMIRSNALLFKDALRKTNFSGSMEELVKLCGRVVADQMNLIGTGIKPTNF